MSPKVDEQHRENKRKQILEAATRVFIRLGYQAATMKDVVEESGLSRGGVYLYYRSTEEMIIDLLQEMDQVLDGLSGLAGIDSRQPVQTLPGRTGFPARNGSGKPGVDRGR